MIKCQQVTKCYREVIPVNQVDLYVKKGESIAIFGESGSGKSTLLRLIAGLEEPNEGEILLDGKKWSTKEPLWQRDVALVFQEPALWNHMTVEQNISFGMRGTRKEKKMFTQELMEALHISELGKRYPYEISGGQAKRVALARACGAKRSILLLDEPLSNLDEASKEIAIQFLLERYKGQCTIVYVTHNLEETSQLCDKWYKMKDGYLTEVSQYSQVKEHSL